MSQRTVVEFNHDFVHRIGEHEVEFLQHLQWALRSGSDREWEPLERFGLRKIVQRHHSSDGVLCIPAHGQEYRLP